MRCQWDPARINKQIIERIFEVYRWRFDRLPFQRAPATQNSPRPQTIGATPFEPIEQPATLPPIKRTFAAKCFSEKWIFSLRVCTRSNELAKRDGKLNEEGEASRQEISKPFQTRFSLVLKYETFKCLRGGRGGGKGKNIYSFSIPKKGNDELFNTKRVKDEHEFQSPVISPVRSNKRT